MVFFDLLRQPVQRSAGARIHRADGRHLGFRGIARVQQRHQVGQGQRPG